MKNFMRLLLAGVVCNFRFIFASNNPLLYTTIGNVDQAKKISQYVVVTSSSLSGSSALSCLNPDSGEVKWNVFLKKNSKVFFLEADDKVSLVSLEGKEGFFLSAFLSNDGSFLWEMELPFEKVYSSNHCSLKYDHESYKATLTKGNQQIIIENVLSSSPKLSSDTAATSSDYRLPSFESKIESNTLTLSLFSSFSSERSLLASSSFRLSSSSSNDDGTVMKEETFLMTSPSDSMSTSKVHPTFYVMIGSFHYVFQFKNNEIQQIVSFQQNNEKDLVQLVKTPVSSLSKSNVESAAGVVYESFSFVKVGSSSSTSSVTLTKQILKDIPAFPVTLYHFTISNSLFSSFSDEIKVFDLSSSSVNSKDRKRKDGEGEKQFFLSSSSGISFFFAISTSSCPDSSSVNGVSCEISKKWIRNDGIGRISKSQYFIISSKYHHHSHDSTVVDEVEANQLNGNRLQGLFHSLTSGQFFQQLSSSPSSLTSENSASCRMNRYLLALSYSDNR
jgi:hypothetical protein